MEELEIDRILGGILRRWITTERELYYCWTETSLTLDASIDITPKESAALSAIGDEQGWWEAARETLSSGQVTPGANDE